MYSTIHTFGGKRTLTLFHILLAAYGQSLHIAALGWVGQTHNEASHPCYIWQTLVALITD